jgi:hypothetical protein
MLANDKVTAAAASAAMNDRFNVCHSLQPSLAVQQL